MDTYKLGRAWTVLLACISWSSWTVPCRCSPSGRPNSSTNAVHAAYVNGDYEQVIRLAPTILRDRQYSRDAESVAPEYGEALCIVYPRSMAGVKVLKRTSDAYPNLSADMVQKCRQYIRTTSENVSATVDYTYEAGVQGATYKPSLLTKADIARASISRMSDRQLADLVKTICHSTDRPGHQLQKEVSHVIGMEYSTHAMPGLTLYGPTNRSKECQRLLSSISLPPSQSNEGESWLVLLMSDNDLRRLAQMLRISFYNSPSFAIANSHLIFVSDVDYGGEYYTEKWNVVVTERLTTEFMLALDGRTINTLTPDDVAYVLP